MPFLLAYVAVLEIDPAGILPTFGVAMVVVALVYRTPFPVQPMKAIGSVAATRTAAGVALSIWNVGVAFLFGLATQWLLRRKLLEL